VKTGAALGQQQQQGRGQQEGEGATGGGGEDLPRRDVMDDLVDRLAALEDSH
jgi:hypothetical protein